MEECGNCGTPYYSGEGCPKCDGGDYGKPSYLDDFLMYGDRDMASVKLTNAPGSVWVKQRHQEVDRMFASCCDARTVAELINECYQLKLDLYRKREELYDLTGEWKSDDWPTLGEVVEWHSL